MPSIRVQSPLSPSRGISIVKRLVDRSSISGTRPCRSYPSGTPSSSLVYPVSDSCAPDLAPAARDLDTGNTAQQKGAQLHLDDDEEAVTVPITDKWPVVG